MGFELEKFTVGGKEIEVVDNMAREMIQTLQNSIYPVGSIIVSTTCASESDVISTYGGTHWIRHSGYMLRGASDGVTARDNTKSGGSDDAVVVQHSHLVSVSGGNHRHGSLMHAGGSGDYGGTTAGYLTSGSIYGYSTYSGDLSMNGTASNNTSWSDGTNKNVPNYKSVYMWERIE